MLTELLDDLKKLQHQRSESSPFVSYVDFMKWADNVAPLLSFDTNIKQTFQRHISIAKAQHSRGDSNITQINEAIGILNQAVLLLESNPSRQLQGPLSSPNQVLLDPPPKVTIKWLYEHVPFPLVIVGFAMLASAFGAGIAFSETNLYALIKNTIKMTTPTSTSTKAKAIEKISTNIAGLKNET